MSKLDFSNSVIQNDMKEILSEKIDWNKLKGTRLLITGATGMIASYLVFYLIYLNEVADYQIQLYLTVRNIDKAISVFGEYLNKDYIVLINQDINDELEINDDINYIIHAASLASPQYYGNMPVETALPNIIGTYRLLEFARKQKKIRGFIFFSSGAVYGKNISNKTIVETDIGPLDFLDNANSYAESKRCGEMLCHSFFSEYNVPAISIRIHHTYGPTLDINNDKRVFSEFVLNYLNDEEIIIKSNGKAKRAFCYITDFIIGLFYVLFYGAAGESYNIGNPECFLSVHELAVTIAAIKKRNIRVVFGERNIEGYKLSPDLDLVMVPFSIEKLQQLGWNPRINCEIGFERVIKFFLETGVRND